MNRFAVILLAVVGATHAATVDALAQDGPAADAAVAEAAAPDTAAAAENVPAPNVTTAAAVAADSSSGLPTPRGVFVRSLIVPGWGHFAMGSYTRGGVYLAIRAANAFMLAKTWSRLSDAQERLRHESKLVRDSLLVAASIDPQLEEQLKQPGALEHAVESHPRVADIDALVGSRKQQREDWITWNLFWLFVNAVDAYVTAHLLDFPAQVSATPDGNGRVQLEVRLKPVGIPW